jgi:hypothetical protein
MSSRIVAFGSEIWHNFAVPVWLERFALVVLAAAFGGIVILNSLKMDGLQRTGIGIAILGLSIYIAQTIYIFNQSKMVAPAAPQVSVPPAQPQSPVKPPNAPPKSTPHKAEDKVPIDLPHGDFLTDTQKQNITHILKEREKEKADVRLVCIGEPTRYADQIQEAFEAAGWPIQRLRMGFAAFSGIGPMSEPLYILTPKADSPTVRAVVDAFGHGRIAAPVHLDLPTIGPGSLGVPAVTIVIQQK